MMHIEDDTPYPDAPTAIVVSVSGGLDSDYAALWARRRWPAHPLILWHAHLEGMDWPETQSHLEQLALVLGNCRLIICQAVYELNGKPTPSGCNGTTLRRVHVVRDGNENFGPAQDDDEAAITTLLDLAVKARKGQPPTSKLRYCTDYFKIRVFDTWARQNRAQLGERAVLLSGERWAESPQRAQLSAWEWRDTISLLPGNPQWPEGWRMLWARPGIDQAFHQVAGAVIHAGIAPHSGYFAQGETLISLLDEQRNERTRARLSCVYCIFSHQHHAQRAYDNRPDVRPIIGSVRDYEAATGYTWQQRGPLTVTC